jgi:uncharacterized protein
LALLSCCAPRTGSLFDLAKNGSPRDVQAALARGVNAREYAQGKTVLIWAARFNPDPAVTSFLLETGAELDARDSGPTSNGWNALMWAAASTRNPDVITTLLKAGADVRAWDKDGLTALLIAAENNDSPGVLSRLVQGGAEVEAADINGFTALMGAA